MSAAMGRGLYWSNMSLTAVAISVGVTGSSVFALADSRQQAEKAAEALRQAEPGWRIFVTRTQA